MPHLVAKSPQNLPLLVVTKFTPKLLDPPWVTQWSAPQVKTTQHKLMNFESKIEGLALRADEQDGYIEGVEDQVEYIETSRVETM